MVVLKSTNLDLVHSFSMALSYYKCEQATWSPDCILDAQWCVIQLVQGFVIAVSTGDQ